MAVNLNPPLKTRIHPLPARSTRYRRRDAHHAPKKIQRKIKVKHKHVLFGFLLTAGLFVALQQAIFFLFSWENLDVRRIDVRCSKSDVKTQAQSYLERKNWGNILLLDIHRIRHSLEAHPWVKEVHVRRIFPSTLRVEISNRIPAAIMKCDAFELIDREGAVLERYSARPTRDLPLLVDDNAFQTHREDALQRAWKLLDSLGREDREAVDLIDLTDYSNVKIRFQQSSTWIKLGYDGFAEKMQSFHADWAELSLSGEWEYIDLSIPDITFRRRRQPPAGVERSDSGKELEDA